MNRRATESKSSTLSLAGTSPLQSLSRPSHRAPAHADTSSRPQMAVLLVHAAVAAGVGDSSGGGSRRWALRCPVVTDPPVKTAAGGGRVDRSRVDDRDDVRLGGRVGRTSDAVPGRGRKRIYDHLVAFACALSTLTRTPLEVGEAVDALLPASSVLMPGFLSFGSRTDEAEIWPYLVGIATESR